MLPTTVELPLTVLFPIAVILLDVNTLPELIFPTIVITPLAVINTLLPPALILPVVEILDVFRFPAFTLPDIFAVVPTLSAPVDTKLPPATLPITVSKLLLESYVSPVAADKLPLLLKTI